MNEEKLVGSIKSWSADDRPREKMMQKGASALSNAELLAILIATGTRKYSAVDLAKQLLKSCNNQLNQLGKLSPQELSLPVKGIGMAKAVTVAAALELGKRRLNESPVEDDSIRSSAQVAAIFRPLLADLQYEEFWILLLSRSNKPLLKYKVGLGGVHQTPVDCRLILKQAVVYMASGIVLCHNHPSGNRFPSEADIRLTRTILEGARLLDIKVLDHIIIAGSDFYSFSDENTLDR
jgi:DNA repair protein RadC